MCLEDDGTFLPEPTCHADECFHPCYHEIEGAFCPWLVNEDMAGFVRDEAGFLL